MKLKLFLKIDPAGPNAPDKDFVLEPIIVEVPDVYIEGLKSDLAIPEDISALHEYIADQAEDEIYIDHVEVVL